MTLKSKTFKLLFLNSVAKRLTLYLHDSTVGTVKYSYLPDVPLFQEFATLQGRVCNFKDRWRYSKCLHGFKNLTGNELREVFTVQLVVLMKILCHRFLVCSNCHSEINSLNENHVIHYDLQSLTKYGDLFMF